MVEPRSHRSQVMEWWGGVLFVFILAASAHLMFSWRGFNPTDEGIVLAGARRILAGQVPHRDFIFIRPALSMYLHLPEVALGGSYVIWLSRLSFWLQEAAMAWLWTGIIASLIKTPLRMTLRMPLALIVFFLSAHTFPDMAWHTIDGLFLTAAGLALIVSGSHKRTRLIGYVILGAAGLCKQIFVPLFPLALLLLGDWKHWRAILAGALPGIAYLLYLLLNGALGDAIPQLVATHGFWEIAVKNYLERPLLYEGIVLGGASVLLLRWITSRSSPPVAVRIVICVLALLGILYFPMQMALHMTDGRMPFAIFGACIGAVIMTGDWKLMRAGMFVCATAWLGSISSGYQTPALGIGPVTAVLLVTGLVPMAALAVPGKLRPLQRFSQHILLLGLAAFIGTGFVLYRTHVLYRDIPAKLTKDLGEVLRGGSMIKTNPETYALLADLENVTKGIPAGKKFTILPDFAAYWIRSPEENPLPTDWPNSFEISTPALMDRLHQPLFVNDTVQYAIIARYDAGALPNRRVIPQRVLSTDPEERIFESWSKNIAEPEDRIKDTWKKVKETEYFEVYKR